MLSVTASALVSLRSTVPPVKLTLLALAVNFSPAASPLLIRTAPPPEVPSAVIFPPTAFRMVTGLEIAVELLEATAMLPFSLVKTNNTEALEAADELFNLSVSGLGELSVIHSCPAGELPVAVALSKSPAPPLFTSIAVLPEVPISPFWALKIMLALVIAVFAGVLATILPVVLVRLNRFVPLDGEDALLRVSVSLALSVIHS